MGRQERGRQRRHQQRAPPTLIIEIVDLGRDIRGALKHPAGGETQIDDEACRLLTAPALGLRRADVQRQGALDLWRKAQLPAQCPLDKPAQIDVLPPVVRIIAVLVGRESWMVVRPRQ